MHDQINHEKVLNTEVKQYMIYQQLGSGTSSVVYMAIDKKAQKQVAIKVIPKEYMKDKKLMELVTTQIYVLKTCNNANVIKCYDVFQSELSIFIVMEYCNGLDMEEYVRNKKYLSEDHAVWFLKQILNGFKGLHEVGAMHRDFKLANLLIHDRVCKIADLGFAKQMKQQDLTSTVLGTAITMAPQILQRKPYGINADIWSLGVVFYQMITGKYPYKGVSGSDLLKNIKNKHNDFTNLRISPLAKNFIQGCLTQDPAARITWVQIYNHELLNKKTMELTYGISKVSSIFYQNQQFYRKKTQQLDESQDSLLILRNSARKKVIIQQIKKVQLKASQCDAYFRNSREIKEFEKLLITFGINYGAYLNQLTYPLKFLNIQFVKNIPKINHYVPLYLIFKKSYYQIRQFLSILQKRINIFKIQMFWTQLLKSSIYNDIISITDICAERAKNIFFSVQDKLRKNLTQGLDQRLLKQMQEDNVKNKEFGVLLEQNLVRYMESLYVLINEEKEENNDLIDYCQGLLYYADTHVRLFYYTDKNGVKKKLTPERFDWNRSRGISYKQARIDLINKFKILLAN